MLEIQMGDTKMEQCQWFACVAGMGKEDQQHRLWSFIPVRSQSRDLLFGADLTNSELVIDTGSQISIRRILPYMGSEVTPLFPLYRIRVFVDEHRR